MNSFEIFISGFLAVLIAHNAYAATTFYMSTYEANPQFLKGSKGRQIRCETGLGNSRLKFYLLEPGLTRASGETSFKSADYDRFYISEKFGAVYLERFKTSFNFAESSSFIRRRNHYNRGTVSYEAVKYPGYYLMCQRGELVIDQPRTQAEAARASFTTETATTDDDNWGPCSRTCGGGSQTAKQRVCLSPFFCEEPRTRPCNTQKCIAESPCRSNPCKHGGTCFVLTPYSYECYCSGDYTGTNCEIPVNPCRPNPCKNGGTCSQRGRNYVCHCRNGYTGKDCDEAINPCMPNPCKNGGRCSRSGSNYFCTCRNGYTGKNCDEAINPCKPNPCQNGGQCSRRGKGYACACPSGYTGKDCDQVVNPCSPSPCKNGGRCTRRGSDYVCSCRNGYTGKNCDQKPHPCDQNPCMNGGTCLKRGSDFLCSCTSQFTGKICEIPKTGSGCSSSPCLNGGTCTDTASGFRCKCAIGYTGITCDRRLSIGQWSTCSRTCGGGTRYRGKSCSANDVTKCPREYQDCNMDDCPAVTCSTYRYGTRSQCCSPSSGSCGNPLPLNFGARIIGGVTSKEREWPWSAAIHHEPTGTYFCGGSLVNNQWVVTAGHCAAEFEPAILRVLLGTNVLDTPDTGHKWFDVSIRILHPTYDNPVDDIGILKLKTAVTFSADIRPVCFPNGEQLGYDVTCYASGWGVGRVEDIPKRLPSNDLLHVGLRTLPLDACVQGYDGTGFERGVTDKIICAGLLAGKKDTCAGDSGGPFVCQRKNSCEWYLAGVTSFGATECGVGTIPGGFMDMAKYEAWIKQQIAAN